MLKNLPEVKFHEGMTADELKSQLTTFAAAHKAAIDAENAKLYSAPFKSYEEFDNFFSDTNSVLSL